MISSQGLTTFSRAAVAFEHCADSYDQLFTRSAIGRAQRQQVWPRLIKAFAPGSHILELNCGTGEDACFLAEHGCAVLACDASFRMLAVARRRTEARNLITRVELLRVANEDLARLYPHAPLHGAFSNFSGLNCVADLQLVAVHLARLLAPGARLLLCLWSRVCASEILYYLLRGRPFKAFRRLSGRSTATMGGSTIPVFYPSVRSLRRTFSPWFSLKSHRAIGLFVPPTYMEPWAQSHPDLMSRFESADRVCSSWPILRGLGDHVLLEFVRCNP
jgi:ubiquinone/menaquinone biosynthesis C-methylase UbiE